MNSCGYQQKSSMGVCDERRKKMVMVDSLVCPKPRRLDRFVGHLQLHHVSHQAEIGDSRAGSELLDIILTKGGNAGEKAVASPPPFYCGSPPSRASNPVVQDARFGSEKIIPLSPAHASPSSSLARQGGGACVRMKFGHKPAAVRIEGFDCLSRDGRNCSISAIA